MFHGNYYLSFILLHLYKSCSLFKGAQGPRGLKGSIGDTGPPGVAGNYNTERKLNFVLPLFAIFIGPIGPRGVAGKIGAPGLQGL